MVDILDISIANKTLKEKNKTRTKNTRTALNQWPRMYGKGIDSIKVKNWTLGKYRPAIVGE